MARILVVMATLAGFTAAASAGTLTVFTTDLSDVPKDTFVVGETFRLKVTGDTEGASMNRGILGTLIWDGSITTTIVDPTGCNGGFGALCTTLSQGNWQIDHGNLFPSDGSVFAFNQCCHATPGVGAQVDTSVITLIADAAGVSAVTWGGTLLDFFGVYAYNDGERSAYLPATASRSFRSRRPRHCSGWACSDSRAGAGAATELSGRYSRGRATSAVPSASRAPRWLVMWTSTRAISASRSSWSTSVTSPSR
jgi:hypothetical protein